MAKGKPALKQRTIDFEAAKRDAALDLLESCRGDLIEIGFKVAVEIARKFGSVTSTYLYQEMIDRGYEQLMAGKDKRWMGVVFRKKCWKRIGFMPHGSHKRPVSVWKYESRS